MNTDLAAAGEQCETVAKSLASARSRLDQLQTNLAQSESRMSENTRRIEELDTARQQRNRDGLATQVELARGEQQLAHLRAQLRRYEQDREERGRTIEEANEQLNECLERSQQAEQRILTAEAEMAELFLQKETCRPKIAKLDERREQLRTERTAAVQIAHRHREKIRVVSEELHAKELAAGEIRHERATLEGRLREDYGIELAELTHQLTRGRTAPARTGGNRNRRAAPQALEHRRRESRFARRKPTNWKSASKPSPRSITDLSQAKGSLEQIIHRINADSRRLFSETLETVKGHFQQLFRKLFGGGQADIVLEEGEDILECGIEIVARPPGKEPRSISLLSGGEKTLTCVALLLAIFRSRPSPFCVLDEVDAALDEANIERFINVLKEFLQWTQFVVVTHSKKTMAFATTLYGVTMQESGVSKRVSVRFDDVSENGEISREALQRSDREQPPIAQPNPTAEEEAA